MECAQAEGEGVMLGGGNFVGEEMMAGGRQNNMAASTQMGHLLNQVGGGNTMSVAGDMGLGMNTSQPHVMEP